MAVSVASVGAAGMSAIRYKVIATELGLEAVGALSVLTGLLAAVVTMCTLGIGASGVRMVAAHQSSHRAATAARQLVLVTGLVLSILASAVCALLLIGVPPVLGSANPVSPVLYLPAAAALTALAVAQSAVINGMGYLGGLAISSAFGSAGGTLLTVAAVFMIDPDAAVPAAILGVPVCTVVANCALLVRAPVRPLAAAEMDPGDRAGARPSVRGLMGLGVAFAAGLAVNAITLYAARIWLQSQGGLAEVGLYQAAWTIGSMYLSFILVGMGSAYFARISTDQDVNLCDAIDSQTRSALILTTVAVVVLMLLAPLVLRMLYTGEFSAAEEVLRWMLVGDILKVPGWAIGYALLARNRKLSVVVIELAWCLGFVVTALALYPLLGLEAMGVAYCGGYVLYLLASLVAAQRAFGYKASRTTILAGAAALVVVFALRLGFFIHT